MTHDDFRLVTAEKELEQVLSEIKIRVKSLAAMTADYQQYGMTLTEVNGKDLFLKLEAPFPRPLIVNEKIDLMVGLPEGFFLIKTSVKALTGSLLMAGFDQEVYKLQRRNNFRAPIPASSKIKFVLISFKTVVQPKNLELRPVDLSAGGVRITWAGQQSLPIPKIDDTLAGQMILPGGRAFEIFGVVKNVITDGLSLQVGVEFQNLSVRDEQALLFTCMDLHRKLATTK